MEMKVAAVLIFLDCLIFASSTAEISVFVQTGYSVQLDLQTQELPAEFDLLSWVNDKSESIVRYITASNSTTPHKSYKDRVDFSVQSFSLTLKNMQKTDSGVYTARTAGSMFKDIVAYRVSVMDEVEAPVLTVKSNWSSLNACSFTCSGGDKIISYIYNNNSCSTVEEILPENYTALELNCSGDVIICNYSNPVSRKTATKKVNELCTVHPEKGKHKEAPAFPHWAFVFICIPLVTLGATGYIYMRRRVRSQNIETLYAEVDENNKPQKSLEMEKTKNPETVYDIAGEQPDKVTVETNNTTPNNNNPMNQNEPPTEKSEPTTVTIYCTIEKQPNPASKADTDLTIYATVNKAPAKYESAHQVTNQP